MVVTEIFGNLRKIFKNFKDKSVQTRIRRTCPVGRRGATDFLRGTEKEGGLGGRGAPLGHRWACGRATPATVVIIIIVLYIKNIIKEWAASHVVCKDIKRKEG